MDGVDLNIAAHSKPIFNHIRTVKNGHNGNSTSQNSNSM